MTERATVRGLRSGGSRARVVAVIAIGALAMTSLSACRSDAGTAAFVGNTRISQATVNAGAASIPANTLQDQTLASERQFIASTETFNALAAMFAKEKGYGTTKPTSADIAAIAAAVKIDPAKAQSNAFVAAYAQTRAWLAFLLKKVPAAKPTEAELQEVFAKLMAQQAFPATATYAQARTLISEIPGLDNGIELQRELTAAATRYHVTINPLYTPSCAKAPCSMTSLPLFSYQPPQVNQNFDLVDFDLGSDPSPAVIDLPSAAATPGALGN